MGIKVAITDDHPLVIQGLENLLSGYPQIEVVATYRSGEELLQGLAHTHPDILLLDIQLPDKTGNELARIISKKYPCVKILALTSMETMFHVKDMMQHGCMGYLTKHTEPETLITAIEQVYKGELFLEPHLQKLLLASMTKANVQSAQLTPLTRREKEVLQLIAAEHTSQEIADKLFLSLRTVESHRLSIMQKLGVKNSIGLVKAAMQMGLVE
jgi:DNA-binding NarL/FixJ family response regulator